jgi:hypothetical protein
MTADKEPKVDKYIYQNKSVQLEQRKRQRMAMLIIVALVSIVLILSMVLTQLFSI